MSEANTGSTGSSQPIDIRQPLATTNYVIAIEGIYPSRNLSTNPLLGGIAQFAGNFAPRGWAFCEGQILPINQHQALYSILGNTYGGDGRTSFALPDLRGRVPIGIGQGPGLNMVRLGQQLGREADDLGKPPQHSHPVGDGATGDTGKGPGSLSTTMPSLGLMPVVALQGIYPSRSLSANPALGDISWFAGTFAPRGWAQASGQLMSIASNNALFSLYGTAFGGDGRTTFALPDLRGRIAIGMGQGPGLSPVSLGDRGGSLTSSIDVAQMPRHNHDQSDDDATGRTGGSASVNLQQPWLALNYQMALRGTFPSRSLEGSEAVLASKESKQSDPPQAFLKANTSLSDQEALKQIKPLIAASQSLWEQAGADQRDLQTLRKVTIELADLAPGHLAQVTSENTIQLDRDGNHRGWYLDSQPLNHTEFDETDPFTGAASASAGDAAQYYDLLTTLLHEQAHVLGHNHVEDPEDLLYGALSVGIRKTPNRELTSRQKNASSDHNHSHDQAEQPYMNADDSMIASIGMTGTNFAPRMTALMNGQILSIASNTALFSLIGTIYGGDGRTTTALPDFRGRAVVGSGLGPGLTPYTLGSRSGREQTRLTVDQLPEHSHPEPYPTGDLASAPVSLNQLPPTPVSTETEEPTLSKMLGLSQSMTIADKNYTLKKPASVTAKFTNQGTLTNTSKLIIKGSFTNNGSLTNQGTLQNNGTLNTSNGTLINKGTMSGNGTIIGFYNCEGTLKPGQSTGGINIEGHFIKSKGRTMIELAGHRNFKMSPSKTQHDFLNIDGDVQLRGPLKVKLIDDYILKPGRQHKIIRVKGNRFGTFNNLKEGDRVKVKNAAGEKLFISYSGGDGNDVVLYTQPASKDSDPLALNRDSLQIQTMGSDNI